MQKDKRERFVSSAQVAYHYSAYTLKEALALSRAERQLLLSVVVGEEERVTKRLETMLGIRWSLEDLVADPVPSSVIPSTVRVPFLPMLAPEMFKSMTEEYRRKYKKLIEGAAPGTVLVDVGTLSTEEAKNFFKSMD